MVAEKVNPLEKEIKELKEKLKQQEKPKDSETIECIRCKEKCDNIRHKDPKRKDYCCVCLPLNYYTKPFKEWVCNRCLHHMGDQRIKKKDKEIERLKSQIKEEYVELDQKEFVFTHNCNKCGRKTRQKNSLGTVCHFTQPNGSICDGIMVAIK